VTVATPEVLTSSRLRTAVAEDAAIRFSAKLQPAGGPGDKVFPPTYTRGQYALESRVVDEHGVVKEVVLLDSVQFQANRMEEALLAAHRAKRITLPMISVNFTDVEQLKEVGEITVLDAPHRLADAILRDSKLKTDEGQVLRRATPKNATELYKLCPTGYLKSDNHAVKIQFAPDPKSPCAEPFIPRVATPPESHPVIATPGNGSPDTQPKVNAKGSAGSEVPINTGNEVSPDPAQTDTSFRMWT
jgi:CRISPR-associated protein Csb1